MKHRRHWMLALLIALALVMSLFAVAENVSGDLEVALDDGVASQQPSGGLDLGGNDASGVTPDIEDAPVADRGYGPGRFEDLPIGDLISDAPEAVVVYRFLVNGAEYAAQTAKAGEEILRPEDPAAPEGMTFEGWFLEDDTPLFADADGDGVVDAVIAHVDALGRAVVVYARFAEKE